MNAPDTHPSASVDTSAQDRETSMEDNGYQSNEQQAQENMMPPHVTLKQSTQTPPALDQTPSGRQGQPAKKDRSTDSGQNCQTQQATISPETRRDASGQQTDRLWPKETQTSVSQTDAAVLTDTLPQAQS